MEAYETSLLVAVRTIDGVPLLSLLLTWFIVHAQQAGARTAMTNHMRAAGARGCVRGWCYDDHAVFKSQRL